MKQVRFGKFREVTNPGDDSRSFEFNFAAVGEDFVGKPEESVATTEHRILVTIANNRLVAWKSHLKSEDELVKVLFEIGRRAIVKSMEDGSLQKSQRELVSTTNYTEKLPFDPSRIPNPEGHVFLVEERWRIGFKQRH